MTTIKLCFWLRNLSSDSVEVLVLVDFSPVSDCLLKVKDTWHLNFFVGKIYTFSHHFYSNTQLSAQILRVWYHNVLQHYLYVDIRRFKLSPTTLDYSQSKDM